MQFYEAISWVLAYVLWGDSDNVMYLWHGNTRNDYGVQVGKGVEMGHDEVGMGENEVKMGRIRWELGKMRWEWGGSGRM